jgi:phospholipid-binding lipoprotein MlaA
MRIRLSTRETAAALLAACALVSAPPSRAELVETDLEEEAGGAVEDEPAAEDEGREPQGVHDPWQGLNRGIFAFNEFLDMHLIEPIATGWDFVMPEAVQQGLDNFFDNIAVPRRIVNDLLQGKPRKAGDDLGRFAVNTTFGLLGFFDPAGAAGAPAADEDFGQTLGVWGVPTGPYLVLPLFGPSNPRDAVGLAVESAALSPEFYFIPYYVSYPLTGTRLINTRSLALETVRAEREAAFDFYAAVRSAYVQYRANQVRDRAEPEEDDEDLYYLEDEED